MNVLQYAISAAIGVTVLVLVVPGDSARAGSGSTTYTVDTTSDETFNGCSLADNDCSLRGAINNANFGGSSSDVINFDAADFPAGAPATIAIATALPALTDGNDTINATGTGVIIDAVNVEPARAAFSCLRIASTGNLVTGVQVTDCLIGIEITGSSNYVYFSTLFDNQIGISLSGSFTHLDENKIGTNLAGTAIHPDGGNSVGISVTGDGNHIGGDGQNIISGNDGQGVDIQPSADLTVVVRNHIGTDISGNSDLGNGLSGVVISGTNSRVGGTSSLERNVISGNGSSGVAMVSGAAGNTILGNYIGTTAGGAGDLGNALEGILIQDSPGNCIGGAPPAAICAAGAGTRNVIAGNDGVGITVSGATSSGNEVFGNYIGVRADGSGPLSNSSHGVLVQIGASNNKIGDNMPGYGNRIAHSGGDGIFVASGTGTQILSNEIFGNTGLGIDLGINGVNPNDTDDPDVGANDLQNYPALTLATSIGAGTTVLGSLNSTPNTEFFIEFFASSSCDPSGFGEGETFIGYGGGVTNGDGDLPINTTLPASVPGLRYVTALVGTDLQPSSTSEFSNCVQVPPIVVNSAADPGDGTCTLADCTLREAMTAANADPELSVIHFAIGSGPQTINVTSPLPDISAQVWINGRTQPGYAGTPIIELNGAGTVVDSQGLSMSAHGNIIEGLVINRFNEFGMTIASQQNLIRNNYIGTDIAGAADLGNRLSGIYVGQPNNFVGGSTAADRNVISGNNANGIEIFGAAVTGVQVSGNYIGPNATGTAVLGNSLAGVSVEGGTDNNVIGGTTAGERNVISGNTLHGVDIAGAGTTGNVVSGNYIGTTADGTGSLTFTQQGGVRLSGGATLNTIGGTQTGAGNVISGIGNGSGILVTGATTDNNTIQGNFIGTNAAGTAVISNLYGISILDASGTLVGGAAAGARNVVSGNDAGAIQAYNVGATANIIKGNYIGTDVTGMVGLGNGGYGVLVVSGDGTIIGGNTAADANVISDTYPSFNGSPGYGISLNSDANEVYGNLVGTAADGTTPLGNESDGVYVLGDNNLIGDTSGGSNTIAFNGGAGVRMPTGAGGGNSLRRGNSIHSNGGLGIDLGDPGVTPNDAGDSDAGPNGLQNYPVLTGVTVNNPVPFTGVPAGTTVQGTIDSTLFAVVYIDLFHSYSCDATGYGEGQTHFGSTYGISVDAPGNFPFSVFTTDIPPAGSFITATATSSGGNTSEFSVCIPAHNDDDDDNDGYTDVDEGSIGTSPNDPCGTDGWASDLFDGGASVNKLTIQDVTSFVAPVRHFDTSATDPQPSNYSPRWDIRPGAGALPKDINIQDVLQLVAGPTGNPPMLNGARAFGQSCPFPP